PTCLGSAAEGHELGAELGPSPHLRANRGPQPSSSCLRAATLRRAPDLLPATVEFSSGTVSPSTPPAPLPPPAPPELSRTVEFLIFTERPLPPPGPETPCCRRPSSW